MDEDKKKAGELMDSSEIDTEDLSYKQKSKIDKIIYKMKNGSPLTKAFVVFLLAPKGLVVFSPLLLAKSGFGPFSFLSAFKLKMIAFTMVKIGLSLASFKCF